MTDLGPRGEEVYGYRFYFHQMLQYHKEEIIILVEFAGVVGSWTIL